MSEVSAPLLGFRNSQRGARPIARRYALLYIVGLLASTIVQAELISVPTDFSFPRLMGMNIGEKNYHDPEYQASMARLDIVILGFYRGWKSGKVRSISAAVKAIKARNSNILLGQYSVLNETQSNPADTALRDVLDAVTKNHWWLLDSRNHKVQWTKKYGAWEVNFTQWTKPDAFGTRYPEWRANRDYQVFFNQTVGFDIWYVDNVMRKPRVRADWDGDGLDDDPSSPQIQSVWRRGEVSHWASIRRLSPAIMIIGNPDGDLSEPEYKGQLEGAFLEGLMGKPWSIERRAGWKIMMERYRNVKANLRSPAIVGFNVHGEVDDYRFFRYAFASCLMDDGYFSFTDRARGYSSVPWFDEYDIKLGRAVDAPPLTAWDNSVFMRRFEDGLVLVNPTRETRTVPIGPGYHRFAGMQDSRTNNGQSVSEIAVPAQDGVVLISDR